MLAAWYQLVDEKGAAYNGTTVAKVTISSVSDVHDFRDAVYAKNLRKLSAYDANDLLVFANIHVNTLITLEDPIQKYGGSPDKHLGINLHCIDASDRFLAMLSGVTDPETKRKRIGNLFIDLFQEEAARIDHPVDFLLQGTLYPDVIESISYKGPSATIKTHHNVGGLPDTMHLKLIEPLRELFKDEVRELGLALGIDEMSVWRHPFPGPGLAIRVLGEVTKEIVERVFETM